MVLQEFIALVAKAKEANEAFWREVYIQGQPITDIKRTSELFVQWDNLEKEIDRWLPCFNGKLCCGHCIHYRLDTAMGNVCARNNAQVFSGDLCAKYEPINN
jgi:hypothetical protein